MFRRMPVRVCITLNNPSEIERMLWSDGVVCSDDRVEFFVFQEELSASGTVHFQAYSELIGPMTFDALRLLFGKDCHFEWSRGSRSQNVLYCTKERSKVVDGLSLYYMKVWDV